MYERESQKAFYGPSNSHKMWPKIVLLMIVGHTKCKTSSETSVHVMSIVNLNLKSFDFLKMEFLDHRIT